eukprot:NODE_6501_length_1666_cov_21.688109.p1 GENE.NODE_6501_length_1666_cov_21.688109~~NODE_6501_length_1666_cov_21.688109.p1  ORF type:complete len:421 (+),score=114.27 NODE_6501_length_1666_cov_21.688109:103-1365(+)
MASTDGFQPCAMETGTALPQPPRRMRWERCFVVVSVGVHVADISTDVLVALLFLQQRHLSLFTLQLSVLLWAWTVANLYVACGGGMAVAGATALAPLNPSDAEDDARSRAGRSWAAAILNHVRPQIYGAARRLLQDEGNGTADFHTLRLLEAIMEAAPSALLQLFALIQWVGQGRAPYGAGLLVPISCGLAFTSVGLSLAMWERKVQPRTPVGYFYAVMLLRSCEIASRCTLLALFLSLNYPRSACWQLFVVNYCCMLLMIFFRQSVQFLYGFFVAFVLVLVSPEPFVWRRQDHAVPKEWYYFFRVVELSVLGLGTTFVDDIAATPTWNACVSFTLLSMLGFFAMLPFVWSVSKQYRLALEDSDVIGYGDSTVQHFCDDFLDSSGSDEPLPVPLAKVASQGASHGGRDAGGDGSGTDAAE